MAPRTLTEYVALLERCKRRAEDDGAHGLRSAPITDSEHFNRGKVEAYDVALYWAKELRRLSR